MFLKKKKKKNQICKRKKKGKTDNKDKWFNRQSQSFPTPQAQQCKVWS